MRVGLLVNEAAGAGRSRIAEGLRALESALEGERIVSRAAVGSDPRFVEGIRRSVGAALEKGAECLVCVGGDGFASYCAEALIRAGLRLPILGIGAGTANVGPLIAVSLDSLTAARGYAARGYAARGYAARGYAARGYAARETDPEPLELASLVRKPVTALECLVDGESLGFAFNDIVFGDTFLGTVDGRMTTLSVDPFLEFGKKEEKEPVAEVADADFSICKNGESLEIDRNVALIVAAPLNGSDFYKGKAALGALSAAPWRGSLGVLALCDRHWIVPSPDATGLCRLAHILIEKDDRVVLRGFGPMARIVIDGNPFGGSEGEVELKPLAAAATVFELDRSVARH